MNDEVIKIWQEKKRYLEAAQAIATSAAQKFELQHQIEECETQIQRLSSDVAMNDGAPTRGDTTLKEEVRRMTVLVFTDLENSTPMKQYLPGDSIMDRNNAYRREILEPHRNRIRGLLTQYQGVEREEPKGDGFLLEFPLPTDAAKFAIAVQQSHRDSAILDGQGNPIRVKIGMQMAYPNPASEIDYASRVIGYATGGQILIAETLYALLKDADIKGVRFHAHGNHELKGIGERPLFELLYDGKSPQPTKKSIENQTQDGSVEEDRNIPQTTNQSNRRGDFSRAEQLRLEQLRSELEIQEKDYKSVSKELKLAIDPVIKNRLRSRLSEIASEMEELEKQITFIEKGNAQ